MDLLVSHSLIYIRHDFTYFKQIKTGQFCHEDATTDEEKGLLYLKGFDPIKIVQRTLTNQPKATMDKLCQFIAQPMIEDIESRYVLIGT